MSLINLAPVADTHTTYGSLRTGQVFRFRQEHCPPCIKITDESYLIVATSELRYATGRQGYRNQWVEPARSATIKVEF